MRETTRFDRVLAILADGARWDVVERLALAGEMPNLRQHFLDCGGLRPATSVFPSVSGPAHLPLLSGLHPGRANLPGIRWAARPVGQRGRFLFRTRSYMAPWRAAKLERDIPATVRTLFHHVPGLADVNTWFVRGCPSRARMTRFSKGASFVKALATTDWYASNLQAEAAVGRAWQRGFPSVYAVFPAIDELGHRFGPLTEQSYEAYRRFDASLGRLIEELHRRGTLAHTLIVITSDHGQTGTHTHVDIDDLMRRRQRPWFRETRWPTSICRARPAGRNDLTSRRPARSPLIWWPRCWPIPLSRMSCTVARPRSTCWQQERAGRWSMRGESPPLTRPRRPLSGFRSRVRTRWATVPCLTA
jgi:hypothetical protein